MSRDSYSAKASSQEKVSLIRPPRPRLAQACGRKINGDTGMAGPFISGGDDERTWARVEVCYEKEVRLLAPE